MKNLFNLMLASLLCLSLGACGTKPQETATAPEEKGEEPAEQLPVETEEDLGDTVVLYSSMTEFDLEALITCFNEVYPDINVEVVTGSVGEYTSRIKAEAGNPQCDVTWGGLTDTDGDRYADIFQTWVSDYNDEAMDGYATPNGLYSMDHLSTVVFCVNTELEKELGLNIRTYEDLLDPALKGKIVLSDPNSSSAAWNNLCNIWSVYGVDTEESWEYIDKLMDNLVVVEKSSACFNSVHDGEYVVGLTYEDGAIKLNQNGSDITEVRYPENGTSAFAAGMALVKDCPHEAAGKALINFVCSAEGQTAMAKYMEGTLRFTNRNYKTPENAWLPSSDEIKWVSRPNDVLSEKKNELLEKWNDLLGQHS